MSGRTLARSRFGSRCAQAVQHDGQHCQARAVTHRREAVPVFDVPQAVQPEERRRQARAVSYWSDEEAAAMYALLKALYEQEPRHHPRANAYGGEAVPVLHVPKAVQHDEQRSQP